MVARGGQRLADRFGQTGDVTFAFAEHPQQFDPNRGAHHRQRLGGVIEIGRDDALMIDAVASGCHPTILARGSSVPLEATRRAIAPRRRLRPLDYFELGSKDTCTWFMWFWVSLPRSSIAFHLPLAIV